MEKHLRIFIKLTIIFLVISFVTSYSQNTPKIKKNILVNIFPGGRSHNFVVKELFDFSLKNSKEIEYVYHILVHNVDKAAWPTDGPYKVYGYGDIHYYEEEFSKALDLVTKHPVFGFTRFNKAICHAYEEFLKSGLVEELKKIKFDMLITDIPNFISVFAREYFEIEHSVYLSPPSVPNLFYNLFELNSTILPAMGSYFFDEMNFFERFINFFFVNGTKFMYRLFMNDMVNVFSKNGYELKWKVAHIFDSFFMIQYPKGFFFNVSFPPNIIRLNAITPRPAKPLNNPQLDKFLNTYKKNVYCSQGTIVKIIDFEKIIDLFNHFNNYGFVMSFKRELIAEELLSKLPKNVFLTNWVNQNDLLGDERIHGFITHGGTNSVSESLYHNKPMVVLGVTLDQINTAAVANKRKVGIVYHKVHEITLENLIYGLEEILKPEEENIYLKNAKEIGKLLRTNQDPREEFTYWIDYIFRLGYNHLLIKSYIEKSALEVNNYDVIGVMIVILIVLFLLIKKLMICLFCSCKSPRHKLKK